MCKYRKFAKGQKIEMHIRPAHCIACGFDFNHDGFFILTGHSIMDEKVVCVLAATKPYYCPQCQTMMDRFADVCEDQHLLEPLREKLKEQEVNS
jgi:hypothetical protein